MKRMLAVLIVASAAVAGPVVAADDSVKSIVQNMTHVERWNRFADKMLGLHKQRIAEHDIRTSEKLGGYFRMPEFYKEVKYIDKSSGRLISLVQWETQNPDQVHTMEIYFHDQQGRVSRDFGLAYLTDGRNAPVQTLINFHAYPNGLHAFRQFDASNNLVYEKCEGKYKGKKVNISLSEMDLLEFEDKPKSVLTSEAYKTCFAELPKTAGKYLTPQ
jgi:hypothetical protein